MSKIISRLTKSLLRKEPELDKSELLKVNSVIGKAARVYEIIRNAVDYQEEHLIRKNGIFRILKRKLLYEKFITENYLLDKFHHQNMTKHLLQELVRGGYIKKAIPLKMVDEIDLIIQKYNQLLTRIKEIDGKVDQNMYNYFLQMAAVEIEAFLIPPDKEKALANAMFSVYNNQIILKDSSDEITDEKEKELQIYLTCFKVLFRWDEHMMRSLLFNLYYPNWQNADEKTILTIANNVNKILSELEKQLHHPWAKQVQKILNKKAIVFWTLRDIIEENAKNPEAPFTDPEKLETEVKKAVTKRYKGVNAKLRRGVLRSIVYVFFTKMILALIIELPMDIYLTGKINRITLAINILFPPFLMFMVAMMIRMPKKENTLKIISEINQIAFNTGEVKHYELKDAKKHGKVKNSLFHFIYALSFIFSLMVLFWGLSILDFNFFSSLIFILFLTLVSFFGIRIRRPVKELLIVNQRQNIITALIDFFSMPFISLGRWMSVKFSKINLLAIIMDVIIEAPYKLLIEVFEGLFGFIKDKKDDFMDEQV